MNKSIKQCGLLLILISASLQGKSDSIDANSLINQVIAACHSLHSYKMVVVFKDQVPGSGKILSKETTSLAYQAPDKLMIRNGKGIYACNGSFEKTFLVSYNQYVIQKEPSNISSLRINSAFNLDPITYFIAGILTHNRNTFPDNSQFHWTAESGGDAHHPIETLSGIEGTNSPVKFQLAINPLDHLITSITIGWNTDRVVAQKVNPIIPAAAFNFIPPNYSKYATYFHYPEAVKKKWKAWQKQENLKREEAIESDNNFAKQMITKYVGQPEVNFTVLSPGGKKVKLSQYLGHVVVVDFWATWCGPCMDLMPTIENINRKLASQGVVVLAVASWEKQ